MKTNAIILTTVAALFVNATAIADDINYVIDENSNLPRTYVGGLLTDGTVATYGMVNVSITGGYLGEEQPSWYTGLYAGAHMQDAGTAFNADKTVITMTGGDIYPSLAAILEFKERQAP